MSSLENLAQRFDDVWNPRRTYCGNFKYSTSSILTCSFCAIMAGYHGARSITDFITDNYTILNHLVGLPFGVPSHDTITRVLSNVDPQQVADICREWAGINKLTPEFLQTDGKTIRGSKENGEKTVHIVSVYAQDFAASLLEKQVCEKENEILAFEQILLSNQIDFQGKTVTGDAMFCQRSFCKSIVERGGDWVFVLKKNQPTLFQSVEEYWKNKEATETKVIPISGHGRKGTKTIHFTTDVDWINKDFNFTGLSCIAEVVTTVKEKGVVKTSTQYLIGSVKNLEKLFIARSKHWGIETMHYILDLTFEEDRCRNRTGSAPLTLNIFRKIGHYFFVMAKKLKEYKKYSTRRLMNRCKAKFYTLVKILSLA